VARCSPRMRALRPCCRGPRPAPARHAACALRPWTAGLVAVAGAIFGGCSDVPAGPAGRWYRLRTSCRHGRGHFPVPRTFPARSSGQQNPARGAMPRIGFPYSGAMRSIKWRSRRGKSSLRSANPGSLSSIMESGRTGLSRNSLRSIIWRRSRLVAATTRTSVFARGGRADALELAGFEHAQQAWSG